MKEKTKAITVKEIDPKTFREFKAACAAKDIKMRQAIINCMKELPKKMKK